MARITPKNWRDFQHYKDRSPPWIRLHRKLLDDKDFHRLPVESRALAPMLWLLAAESVDGSINADTDDLAFRLRTTELAIRSALDPLLERGFFVVEQDASNALADCKQLAPKSCSETEALHINTEAETSAKTPRASRKPTPTPMPDDFDISDRVKAWAKDKGYENLSGHLEAFKAKVQAKGYRYVDWDSAFMEAIREDWAKLRGQGAVRGQAPPPERSSNPWWETGPGIRSKGIELGIGDWRDGAEQWHPYRNAVFKAAKARGELPEGVGI